MEQVTNRATDDAVHWVLCSDGREPIEAHLSCLPKDRSAMLLVATDLLTLAEKAAGGLT